jgi:hypothetical protein
LLGCIRSDAVGELHIEDASGSVLLRMGKADTSAVDGFLTEGMCMVVEGRLLPSGKFEAIKIRDPPVERASAARESLQGFSLSGTPPLSCAPHPRSAAQGTVKICSLRAGCCLAADLRSSQIEIRLLRWLPQRVRVCRASACQELLPSRALLTVVFCCTEDC